MRVGHENVLQMMNNKQIHDTKTKYVANVRLTKIYFLYKFSYKMNDGMLYSISLNDFRIKYI